MGWPNRWSWSNAVAQGERNRNQTWAEQLTQGTWGSVANYPNQPATAAPAAGPAAPQGPSAAELAAQAQAAAEAAAAAAAAAELERQKTHYMDAFRAFFSKVGMALDSELEGILRAAIDKGYTDADIDIIMPDIQNTQVFKTRFSGYHARIANGYNAISIGEYLALEDQYHRVMQEAGLPAGFYDDPSDYGGFISRNVSVEEIQTRVRLATDMAKQVDPTMRNLMSTYYGLGPGEVAAYFLDANRALPAIEHQYKAAGVASWAARNGFAIDGMKRFEQLVADGITPEQAAQGYGTARALTDSVGKVAGIYGESYGQTDAEQDVFFNDNEKRRRIMQQESATFGGQSKGSTGTAQRSSY